jgi:2-polyprenyl-3-methyl-5-hydroxy-6-metoxy-1,4-benzoquinol methylase
MDSKQFWVDRYEVGGNSGAGSTGRLNEFKTLFLNSLIEKFNITSIIDLGCGQGAILQNLRVSKYVGFDVSEKVIVELKESWQNCKNFEFRTTSDVLEPQELSLSFDVIFHLIEDEIYSEYISSLFSLSKKYVLICSSNTNRDDPEYATAMHVKHRIFTDDVPSNFQLTEQHDNIFPYLSTSPEDTSWSNFYLYEKIK